MNLFVGCRGQSYGGLEGRAGNGGVAEPAGFGLGEGGGGGAEGSRARGLDLRRQDLKKKTNEQRQINLLLCYSFSLKSVVFNKN